MPTVTVTSPCNTLLQFRSPKLVPDVRETPSKAVTSTSARKMPSTTTNTLSQSNLKRDLDSSLPDEENRLSSIPPSTKIARTDGDFSAHLSNASSTSQHPQQSASASSSGGTTKQKKASGGSTRTGQACDRCKVCANSLLTLSRQASLDTTLSSVLTREMADSQDTMRCTTGRMLAMHPEQHRMQDHRPHHRARDFARPYGAD